MAMPKLRPKSYGREADWVVILFILGLVFAFGQWVITTYISKPKEKEYCQWTTTEDEYAFCMIHDDGSEPVPYDYR